MEAFEKYKIIEAGNKKERKKNFMSEKNFRADFLRTFDLRDKSSKELKTLKEKCIIDYPQQAEVIESLFGLAEYLKNQKTIKKNREYSRNIKEIFQNQTEYMFLLSHLVNEYSDQPDYLDNLWSLMHNAGHKVGEGEYVSRLKRGVVTQVATFKIFDKLGLKPELSHPRQDAYEKIDMWVSGGEPVQIKRGSGEQPVILETDSFAFPAAKITADESTGQAKDMYINSSVLREVTGFCAKVSKYSETVQRDIRGYFILIPPKKINSVTGEPSPDLVEAMREQFKSIE